MAFPGYKTVVIPVPTILPLGVEIGPQGVQDVWDAFVTPHQESGEVQSMEMRSLMAILRSVKVGLDAGPIIEAE